MEMEIRSLTEQDLEVISTAFAEIGWNKSLAQYQRYLAEQKEGSRDVLVARVDGNFAGYVTIRWLSDYPPFAEDGIPEVKDLNVLPIFRRRGIGTQLMERAEKRISKRSNIVGIGVGMYSDYGGAQRMYVLRGYVPDGRGLTYRSKVLAPMEDTVNDDNLVLYFTKTLK